MLLTDGKRWGFVNVSQHAPVVNQQRLNLLATRMELFARRFMRVDLNLTTNYKQGMDLHQLAGDFT